MINDKHTIACKRTFARITMISIILTIAFHATYLHAVPQPNISFQTFYDQLSPYGQWIDHPDHGYVWMPDAGQDFVPYATKGRWVLTEYGWAWASDYTWGWAPFHYGRWGHDGAIGWFWVPDSEWGPSWVTWRRAAGYYGWTPMRPGVSTIFGFKFNGRDNDRWIFIRDMDIERAEIQRYSVFITERDRVFRESSLIQRTYVDKVRHTAYVSGPDREDVQKATGRHVRPVAIRENAGPGPYSGNGELRIYRPHVEKNDGRQQQYAPSKTVNFKNMQRLREQERAHQTASENIHNSKKNDMQQQPSPPVHTNRVSPSPPRIIYPQDRRIEEQKKIPPAITNKEQSSIQRQAPVRNERAAASDDKVTAKAAPPWGAQKVVTNSKGR